MPDITILMKNYREALRTLWNSFMRPVLDNDRTCLAMKRFHEWECKLYHDLVLEKIGVETTVESLMTDYKPYLRVEVKEGAPLMVQREGESGYWDDPVLRFTGGKSDFRFIEFFDWDELDYRDCRYYRVRILEFAEHPHLKSREALIETIYGKISIAEIKANFPRKRIFPEA